MKMLNILWRFSRPHTIIGSAVSIFTLYMIVCNEQKVHHILYLLMALGIGISCNIFIVGINQIADIRIDMINKPHLPIPAGVLNVQEAKTIVFTSIFISLGLAICINPYLFGIILLSATIGWAYSMPPFYLKQHHITAALAISIVRGVLLNAGGFLVFNFLINHTVEMPQNVQILTLFIIAFSVVISWFKDLSDVEGDAAFQIKTFAIQYTSKVALITGNIVVVVVYLFTIYMKNTEYRIQVHPSHKTRVLLYGHIVLLVLFVVNAFSIRLGACQSVKRFYKRFWWFFFAEYVLYLLAYTTAT